MPDIEGGMARYNLDDPEDLAVLIDRGLIWKGGPAAYNKAIKAVLSGAVPRPTRNVPPQVEAIFEERGIPLPAESGVPPAEPEVEE